MATNIWTNGAAPDQEWLTAGNWALAHAPLATEDVVLNGTATGSITCNGGPSTAAGVELNSFTRMAQYTGDVGTSAFPLRFSTVDATIPPAEINPLDAKGKAIIFGPGKFFFENADGGVGNEVDYMYIDTDNQSDIIELTGQIDNLTLVKGRVTGLVGLDVDSLFVTYRTNPISDSVVLLQNTALMTALSIGGGKVTKTAGQVIFVTMLGGQYLHDSTAGQFSTLVLGGGKLTFNPAASIGFAGVLGGTLDMSQDGRDKTISLLLVQPGAVYLSGPHVTITNGGSILPLTDIIP